MLVTKRFGTIVLGIFGRLPHVNRSVAQRGIQHSLIAFGILASLRVIAETNAVHSAGIVEDEPSARATNAFVVRGTLVVTNCDDSGAGSLRNAVASAVSGDLIDLSQLSCSPITLNTGAIAISVDSLTVSAMSDARAAKAGAWPRPHGDFYGLQIQGNQSDRLFDHTGHGTLELDGLYISGGSATGNGGCIRSDGTVNMFGGTVFSCVAHDVDFAHGKGGALYAADAINVVGSEFAFNFAYGNFPIGGGLFTPGTLTMSHTRVEGNSAYSGVTGDQGLAGGIYARTATIAYSTIDKNGADLVGGIDTVNATISNSTIYRNTSDRIGGILATTSLTLDFVTIAGNHAQSSDGGVQLGGTSLWQSSIVADNSTGSKVFSDVTRANSTNDVSVTGDHNLIIVSTVPLPGDTLRVDPMLQGLADNGNGMPTLALQFRSPAIDAGGAPMPLAYDERGAPFARVHGVAADIGAYEYGADVLFSDDFEGHLPKQTATYERHRRPNR